MSKDAGKMKTGERLGMERSGMRNLYAITSNAGRNENGKD
jgi:hypothetical protein